MRRSFFFFVCLLLIDGCLVPRDDDPDCNDTCRFARDGECDDGGPDALYDLCGLGTDCSDCGPGSRGGPVTTSPTPTTGACVGVAAPARNFDDTSSCSLQGGDWSSTFGECRGGTTCARRFDRDRCWQVVGCEWEDESGRSAHPLAYGTCEGTPVACDQITLRDECTSHRPCRWSSSDGRCDDQNSIRYVNNATCEGLSAAIESQDLNPSVGHSACLRTYGCRWIHGDGSVEEAFEGQEPTTAGTPTMPAPPAP